MSLNRDDILRLSVIGTKPVYISALGGEILLRQLSSQDVLSISMKFQNGEMSFEDYTQKLILLSVVDEDGSPIFDAETAKNISISVSSEIFQAIIDYNNLEALLNKEKATADLKKVQAKSR